MPYGNQSELLGAGMDPRLMLQDFSGYADAAKIQAAGIMNAAETVSNRMEDYAKEQKKAKEALKSGAMMIDAASKMFPSQSPAFNGISQQLKDENIPLNERAAMASQIGDLINMTVGEGRYQREMGMKEKELDWRMQGDPQETRMNDLRITEAEMEIDRRKQEDSVMGEVGAARFERALKLFDSIPEKDRPFTSEYLEKAKTMDPRTQFKLADFIEQSLPQPVKKELKTIPATINGQPGEMPVLIDAYGNMDAVPMGDGVLPPKGWQGGDAPPAMMQTIEGPELPAGEAKKIGKAQATDGTPLDVMAWNNAVYHVPSSGPSVVPGKVTAQPGQLSEKDKYEIAKDRKTEVQSQQNAVAKSQEFLNALTKLENHPGFGNLFGTNVGVPTWVAGTDGAGAKALFNQIEGKGFLESIQAMKGMGALSNAEGEKVSSAFLGITPSMSEQEVRGRIKEIKETIQAGMNRAAAISAPAPPDPVLETANRLRAYANPR